MTPDETVVLARYVKALCPQQKFDEYTPDAWHDVLGDFALADARAAAAAVARRQPFVSPAEIIDEIRKVRDARASAFQGPGLSAEVPDADPDDVQAYLAALRGQRTRAADGLEMKRRPVAQLLAGVGRAIPDEVAEVKRPGPLGIECPNCGAAIGRPCRTPGGKERAPHSARQNGGNSDEQAEAERRKAASARHLARQHDDIPDAEIVDEEAAS
ncbi:hypothetical protein ACIBBD_02230 [Streptomyces sp. NPDC051315]|uniref:zinc finger domain-containing protein n=1 Tax=Streptomyces sp. NPDC051315 TaxID=3365650 RepID=UPI0037969643